MKKPNNMTISEKIAFVGLILCLIGILILAGLTIFTENDIPSYWLSLLSAGNMFFCSLGNWKTQRTLAKMCLIMGSVILISGLIIIFA